MNLINSILLQSDGNIVGRIERINDINLSDENVKGTERISRLFNKNIAIMKEEFTNRL